MSLKHAIDAGDDMLQHCDVTGPVAIPDSLLDLIRERNVYCATLPRTRERLRYELGQNASEYGPQLIDVMHFNDIRLVQAGVPLLLSTDAGMMDPDAMEQQKPEQLKDRSTTLGDGHFLWFKAMQENGIKPMDAILAATKNIAAAYHKLDELGTIEKGKLADLVVLDADPLDDLNNIRKISMVMKDGQVVDREQPAPEESVDGAARHECRHRDRRRGDRDRGRHQARAEDRREFPEVRGRPFLRRRRVLQNRDAGQSAERQDEDRSHPGRRGARAREGSVSRRSRSSGPKRPASGTWTGPSRWLAVSRTRLAPRSSSVSASNPSSISEALEIRTARALPRSAASSAAWTSSGRFRNRQRKSSS